MEISNNALTVLLMASVVVSIGGTLLSLNKLNSLNKLTTTTGLASSNSAGVAQLNITTLNSISFTINAVDFGSGSVNVSAGYNNCTLSINGSSAINKIGCINFYSTNPYGTDSFILTNDGSSNMNISLNVSENASDFIGGNMSIASFQYALSENETGSCSFPLSSYDWQEFTIVETNICGNLSFLPNTNSLRIGVKVVIPTNAPQGSKSATLIASGVAN